MNKDLQRLLDLIATLQPATKDWNPGIGAGKLNRLIELGELVAKQEFDKGH